MEIEKGRYKNLPVNQRLCGLCDGGAVVNEIHFSLQCPSLGPQRSLFLEKINIKFKNFSKLDNISKFIWLMSNEDSEVMKEIKQLLSLLFETRCNKLQLSN